MNTIHYGFGLDYLKDWGIDQALREVYQNFLDYGDYKESVKKISDGKVVVTLSNDWQPESLDFLRIGNSVKKEGSIGKHGEGVKMAFMIFLRLGLKSKVITHKHVVIPSTYEDEEIGECFCLHYFPLKTESSQRFRIQFTIDSDQFQIFKSNVIQPKDIEFSNPMYGDILHKEAGSIYSGGLFVAKVQNVGKAYNIKPEHLQLDRDRSVPRAFDVNWTAGRILDSYDKWKFVDDTYDDTQYIQRVPDHFKHEVRPVIVGSTVEFTRRDESGEEVPVKNEAVKSLLREDSFFEGAIRKLKEFVAKKLGLYDLLLEFRDKHVHSQEARTDFDLILERIKSSKESKNG